MAGSIGDGPGIRLPEGEGLGARGEDRYAGPGGLDAIFKPRSVAVIGASANPEKRGHIVLRNILDGGFCGPIYPVNPGGGEILGLKVFQSVESLPKPVDLAVVVIPAQAVPQAIRDAGMHGIKGAVIISGGFREVGNDLPEREILEAARACGMRIIGPNCQGVNYTYSNLCASWPLITSRGGIAVISQSGTVGAAIAEWAESEGIGISAFVSLGNKADIDEVDLVNYFIQDPNTRAISLYIEGTQDGRRFLRACREAAGVKPVVILRPGRTEKGRKAAESHTKSIAGSHLIFDAACRQAGVIKAATIAELYDIAKIGALSGRLADPAANRIAIITSSGGSGIIATDSAEENGLEVADLQGEVAARLRERLPGHCVVRNPLDLTGDTTAERYEAAVDILSDFSCFSMFLLIFGDPIPRAADTVAKIKAKLKRGAADRPGGSQRGGAVPMLATCCIGGGRVGQVEAQRIQEAGVPVFPTPERAVKALAAMLPSRRGGQDLAAAAKS